MRIPLMGDSVLVTFAPASEQNGNKAIVRPGRITDVLSYNAHGAKVSIMVDMNGPTDVSSLTPLAKTACHVDGMSIWLKEVSYDCKQESFSFTYRPYKWQLCETIRTRGEITHGREIIADGAEATYDESTKTFTFKRDDVKNLGSDLEPVYPAKQFGNLHASRLEIPDTLMWQLVEEEATGEETAEEALFFRLDLWLQENDPRYRRLREQGMEADMPASFMKMIADRMSRAEKLSEQGSPRHASRYTIQDQQDDQDLSRPERSGRQLPHQERGKPVTAGR